MGNKTSSTTGRRVKKQSADPAPMAASGLSSKLALGAGCYWGTEKYVVKNFQKKFPGSIKKTKVGFMSPYPTPRIRKPNYRQVCSGSSGHVEVLYVELNEPEKHFEELIRFFFCFHDPTTKNQQGNDRGFQYASFIFCGDEEQIKIASRVRDQLQDLMDAGAVKVFTRKEVTTKVGPWMDFTEAHAAHQAYLEKNPRGYCNHRIRLTQWPMITPMEETAGEAEESAK